jgi:proton-coupled amino acid transporter
MLLSSCGKILYLCVAALNTSVIIPKGYLCYSAAVQSVINVSAAVYRILLICFRAAQAVKILIALAVFCTYGLQFYVCLEIAWNGVKDTFTKRPLVSEYAIRTFLVVLTSK